MAYRSHKAAIRVRSEAFVKDNSRNLALRDMRHWIRTPKKFGGMSLPGGVQLNGDQMYQEAEAEIKELFNALLTDYQEPLSFFIG